MTDVEIIVFLHDGGAIDCNDDYDTKQSVLETLENIGFEIGFDKVEADRYRYVYYAEDVHQIHMNLYPDIHSHIKNADEILCECKKISVDPCDLYDGVEFFYSQTED